ncbi:HNH endonuclease [Cellulomonas shaoxiangyii]|uniref:HNH endonuclease n=1 Tax=Cellulomonas shaoxiangyii TaxID=2566013 RepID=A0A4P7SIG4_9CELL|nr:HNH endonuclease [Cellulomonas shaoxiangyii]QCB93317.1 HNH endonuclease [Cellulomonas shaoxiangyii]TGY79422.1 HNH endonuclease [Cellulomonas shaoxiangyii]
MVDANRFWSHAAPASNGCLEWAGATFGPGGYGAAWDGERTRGAHRVAYELTHGPIPDGLLVRHACDNRRCVKPEHLSVGTYADNARDCTERARKATGHHSPLAKLTDDQVAEIRALYATGKWTQRELGRRFSVTQARVWQIVHDRVRTAPSVRGVEFRPVGEATS